MSITQHARRILDALPDDLRDALCRAPLSALKLLGLTANPIEELHGQRGEGGWCDGVSFLDDGVILYRLSPNSRRENFTVAHEVAHWLVDNDDDAASWVADCDDAGRVLEQLCDHIAGQLLIPTALATTMLGEQPIRAAHLRALFDATQASEPACAIAVARQLHGIGAVIIVDRATAVVQYASIAWSDFDGKPIAYPWPGQTLPDGHLLRRMEPGSTRTDRSWWATPWGERHDYYLDAVAGTNRIHAIFSEVDLWNIQTIHFDKPERQRTRPSHDLSCPCGFTGPVTGYPHDTCREPFCPKCGSCGCQRRTAKHQPCARCFVHTPPIDLVDGVCSMCR
nr:hypothetical protein GCM10020063_082170 [Dactylosporangium thailandense]